MTTLEIIHLPLAWKDTGDLVGVIHDSLGAGKEGMEVRVFRHARFEGDLHVHLLRRGKEEGVGTSDLGDQLASLLRKHGMVDHSVWLEAGASEPK